MKKSLRGTQMMKRWLLGGFSLSIFCLFLVPAGFKGISTTIAAKEFDLVILNGRVIDPESKLDAVRNVGIIAGKIEAITTKALQGRSIMDAKGLVVAPGFIDL